MIEDFEFYYKWQAQNSELISLYVELKEASTANKKEEMQYRLYKYFDNEENIFMAKKYFKLMCNRLEQKFQKMENKWPNHYEFRSSYHKLQLIKLKNVNLI